MTEEIELKLRLPTRAVKLLLAHPLLQNHKARRQRLHNTYFDTPDLMLKAARIELRHRQSGQHLLQTVKSGNSMTGGLASRGEWEEPTETGHFGFANIDDNALRDCLETSRDHLQPLFTTEFSRISWQLHARPDSAIELALDRGVIESQGRQTPICEVELELKAGNPADLFELASQLQQTLPLHPAAAGKAARGYALWLDETAPLLKAKAPALAVDLSPVGAFRIIALTCLRHLQGNEEGIQATADEPEYIHQMRVAVRRLRSALKLFAPVLPRGFVEDWNSRWRDLGSQLGQARNWDVFATQTLPPLVATFPEVTEAKQLTKVSERQRAACRKAVRSAIAADAHSCLLLDFTAALYSPPFLADGGPLGENRANAETSPGEEALSDFAARRLARLAKRAKKLARRVHELDEAERHRMRIAFKKLRYAVEFFAALLPTRRLKPYLKELEKLQDALGELNDLAVAQGLIAGLSRIRTDRIRTAGVRADGLAAGWLAARNDLLLGALPQKLDRFLDIKPPWR